MASTSAPMSANTTGVGHRREDAPFMPLQGEDRQMRGDDDRHREHRRAPDFARRRKQHGSGLGGRRVPQAEAYAGASAHSR